MYLLCVDFSILLANQLILQDPKPLLGLSNLQKEINQLLLVVFHIFKIYWIATSPWSLHIDIFDACSVRQCVMYIVLQQSMLLSSFSLYSLLVCQKKWTTSTSPAPRCDRFFSLSAALQAALLPPHTHTHTLYHTDTQSSSFCGPVTEDGEERKEREG